MSYEKTEDVKKYCTKNQFPPLSFRGIHNKPHVAHGLGKN